MDQYDRRLYDIEKINSDFRTQNYELQLKNQKYELKRGGISELPRRSSHSRSREQQQIQVFRQEDKWMDSLNQFSKMTGSQDLQSVYGRNEQLAYSQQKNPPLIVSSSDQSHIPPPHVLPNSNRKNKIPQHKPPSSQSKHLSSDLLLNKNLYNQMDIDLHE